MKRPSTLVQLVAVTLPLLGCGEAVAPIVPAGLILKDSATQAFYSLTITNGGLALTGIAGSPTPATPQFVDSVTGADFAVGVTSGALILSPLPATSTAFSHIALADSATDQTYSLAVAAGALTVTQGEMQ